MMHIVINPMTTEPLPCVHKKSRQVCLFLNYVWLCRPFVVAWAFHSCGVRGYSSLWGVGPSRRCLPSCGQTRGPWAFHSCGARAPHRGGFPSCGAQTRGPTGFSSRGTQAQYLQAAGSRAWAQQLWHLGWVALRYVESPRTRDWTHVPCS